MLARRSRCHAERHLGLPPSAAWKRLRDRGLRVIGRSPRRRFVVSTDCRVSRGPTRSRSRGTSGGQLRTRQRPQIPHEPFVADTRPTPL
jgi:hypothetical protein